MRRLCAVLALVIVSSACVFRASTGRLIVLECPDGTRVLSEVDGSERAAGPIDAVAQDLVARVARSIVGAALSEITTEPDGSRGVHVIAGGKLVARFGLTGEGSDWVIDERSECVP